MSTIELTIFVQFVIQSKIPPHHFILAGILVISALLRFYKFTEIPMTNDELSALSRTSFHTWNDLINKGIRADGHPPLVQLFLYGLVKLFGHASWLFKLPFALCGMASIYYAYRLGTLVVNRNTGLMLAGFMATNSYFIMYSQLARPYAPGLLVCLLFACSGMRVIRDEHPSKAHYFTHGLWLFMAAGIHHFAWLTAMLTLIPLLLFSSLNRKKLIITYLITGMVGMIYLPVLLDQLHTGGVGSWLAKPDKYFLLHFLNYLCSYNTYIILLMLSLLLATLSRILYIPRRDIMMLSITFGIFLMTCAIGYGYSVWRNPVLQYSVLLFAVPFLLIAIFYGMSRWRFRYAYFTLGILMCANVWGLTQTRSYYQLFYHQGYQAAAAFTVQYPKSGILLSGNHPDYFNYYLSNCKEELHIYSYRCDTFQPARFIELLRVIASQHNTLVMAYGMPANPNYMNMAQRYFPNVVNQKLGAAYEAIALCKGDLIPEASLFENPDNRSIESFNTNKEFGASSSIKIDETADPSNLIEASVVMSNNESNPLLVLSFHDGDIQTGWLAASLNDFRIPGDSTIKIQITVRAGDAASHYTAVRAYVWNKNKGSFITSIPQLMVRKGNPLLYGLIENIPSNLR